MIYITPEQKESLKSIVCQYIDAIANVLNTEGQKEASSVTVADARIEEVDSRLTTLEDLTKGLDVSDIEDSLGELESDVREIKERLDNARCDLDI